MRTYQAPLRISVLRCFLSSLLGPFAENCQRCTLKPCLSTSTPSSPPSGRNAELAHPGQERELVAEKPHAQRPAAKVFGRLDPGFLAAGQHHARPLERLGDVDQRNALLARGERGGHPFDDDIGAAAGDHLRRRDGPARPDWWSRPDRLLRKSPCLSPHNSRRTAPAWPIWAAASVHRRRWRPMPPSAPSPYLRPVLSICAFWFSLFAPLIDRVGTRHPVLWPLASHGRMPECHRPLDQRNRAVGERAGKRGDEYRGPHHVDIEPAHFRRNAEAHADNGCAEKLCDDRTDQRKRRIDLQGVEDERHRRRQPQLDERLRARRRIGVHQIALHVPGRIQAGDRVHQHRKKGHHDDHGGLGLPVEAEPHHHDRRDADDGQRGDEIADRHHAGLPEGRAVDEDGDEKAERQPIR